MPFYVLVWCVLSHCFTSSVQ
uniref:Uncharacterized protein n=1 Tax=Anguilla anguilla TaxID=7936 RepID=A0A0E9TGL2_ANGAN